MARMFRLLPVLALLGGIPLVPRARAQTEDATLPAPMALPADSAAPNPLPGLPRPPDQPRSLFQEAPPAPPFACVPLPGPYFEPDPRLDPPELPPPGWFTDGELGIATAHVINGLTETVQVGTRPPDTVALPSAHLDWTASPRVEVGYRLPSGFGEFALDYRFFDSHGAGLVPGPDATASLQSRLEVNVGDLDYASRELSIWSPWKLKWRLGLRVASVFFDSQAEEPFAAAAAGSGIVETRTSNTYVGAGPHYGLQLTRRWQGSGLALVSQLDSGVMLGELRQDFIEVSTSPAPGGGLLSGFTRDSNPQAVPTLTEQLGLSWQPPGWPCATVFVGYQYETWWNVGRMSTTTSRGQLDDHGVLLRAEFNF